MSYFSVLAAHSALRPAREGSRPGRAIRSSGRLRSWCRRPSSVCQNTGSSLVGRHCRLRQTAPGEPSALSFHHTKGDGRLKASKSSSRDRLENTKLVPPDYRRARSEYAAKISRQGLQLVNQTKQSLRCGDGAWNKICTKFLAGSSCRSCTHCFVTHSTE